MANHIVMKAAESAVNAATAVAALNVLFGAQITAANPQSVVCVGANVSVAIAVGPLQQYVAQGTVQYVG